jgi:multisubunit Na+/H+ antiporter MnhC subunit
MPCQFNYVYEFMMVSRNMPRRIIALLIALYAIAFAFGAMAAIRWPSLMMLASFAFETDPLAQAASIDWRELGILFGAPYFIAAFCLYASAMMLNKTRRGAMTWYIFGCAAGFLCIFFVDFADGWWRDPSAGEGAIAGAAVTAVLLGLAIWNLRTRKTVSQEANAPEATPIENAPIIVATPTQPIPKKRKRRGPVPAAIARQRAQFAADGRRMLAKQRRS